MNDYKHYCLHCQAIKPHNHVADTERHGLAAEVLACVFCGKQCIAFKTPATTAPAEQEKQ